MLTNSNSAYDGPIQIKDERLAPWFSIDHGVILDWLPIIGPTGYALYSVYMSLAAQRLPAPGIRRLANHIGASPQSIMLANKTLEWAGLIRITSGDRETPNTYHITNIPAVTPEILEHITASALADVMLGQDYATYYRRRLLEACAHWRPFWQRQPGSILRAKAPSVPATVAGAAAEQPPAGLAGRLVAIGMADGKAAELIATQPAELLDGWLTWMEAKIAIDPNYFRNPAGYLLRVIANGDQAPEPPAVEPEHLCSLCQKRAVDHEGELCQNCQEKYADFVRR